MNTFDDLWDQFVDPADAVLDSDGTRWAEIGVGLIPGAAGPWGVTNEQQLREIRNQCRHLAATNEFAINGHENRVSFIVGSGHTCRVTAKGTVPSFMRPREASARKWDCPPSPTTDPAPLVAQVQAVLDEFTAANGWHKRQQEIVRRRDRDGEVFLRFFLGPDGITRLRFVEPSQVSTPSRLVADPAATFGIQTDLLDVETVLGYWIDGQWVDATSIQHRKANVDANVKRGLPLFYPVRKNLRRADKLLRNMSVVAGIQSAIAIIRKHASGTRSTVQQFVQSQADASLNPTTGRPSLLQRYAPGTILDAFAGTEYQFPVAAIDASRYVAVLQAELRAIASRLVMPEFMLTSDASNANYASTMVAEGPAVRMFERLQHETIEDDLQVMWRVVAGAVESGRLPRDALTAIDIQCLPPPLAVRDRLKEVQADRILVQSGAMSVQTMAARNGLDPEHEQQLIRGAAAVRG